VRSTRSQLVIRAIVILATWPGLAMAAGLFDRDPVETVPTDAPAPIEIRDLHYGDVLFDFYNGDLEGSLLKLRVYEAQGLLRHHAEDARLLQGGLYLAAGQHVQAGQLFQSVLDGPAVPAAVRDRARFLLGKVWYQRGYDREAEQALAAVSGSLPPAWEEERRQWLAQSLLRQGKFDAAIALLAGWPAGSPWRGYAGFNLGVALVKAGRLAEGIRELEWVGQLPGTGEERAALRDKAWLAAGSALLKSGDAAAARAAFEKVRLEGPLSNRALLAAGWASAARGEQERALVPWLELQGRTLVDAAVQESYLAIPQAYQQLGADAQAVEQYQAALRAFAAERARLEESIAALRKGRLLRTIADKEGKDLEGWLWQVRKLPDLPETRYLLTLLASHDFQEALKNHRSLVATERRLAAADRGLDAFREMVTLRRGRFATVVPGLLSTTDAISVPSLRERQQGLATRLDAAVGTRDAAALANAREQSILERLARIEATLAARPEDPDLADAREGFRLLKGLLQWRMSAALKPRSSALRRSLDTVHGVLPQVERARAQEEEARTAMPARYADYAMRIDTLQPRLAAMRDRVRASRARQEQFLSSVAIRELQAQQARLGEYEVRARFALAAILDRRSGGGQP